MIWTDLIKSSLWIEQNTLNKLNQFLIVSMSQVSHESHESLTGTGCLFLIIHMPVTNGHLQRYSPSRQLHSYRHWRIQGWRQGRAPWVQILSFSCSFRQKFEKIIAILGVGAPPWGKSWIHHWPGVLFDWSNSVTLGQRYSLPTKYCHVLGRKNSAARYPRLACAWPWP